MLHIVNETEKDFKLAVENEQGSDWGKLVITTTSEDHDVLSEFAVDAKLKNIAAERIDAEEGGYLVKSRRSTKFFVSEPGHITMYDHSPVSGIAEIVSVERGLDKNSYRLPKSVIVVITDMNDDVTLEDFSHEQASEKNPVFASANSPIVIEALQVKITVFFCNYSKWQSIKEKIYINLPCGHKLLFGSANKVKNGNTSVINALIRCDAEGNAIRNEKKQHNNGGNRQRPNNNNRGKGKKNFGKRGDRSAVTKGLPRIQNV